MAKGEKEFKKINLMDRKRINKETKKIENEINRQTKQERLF